MNKQFRIIFTSFFLLIVLGKGVLAYINPGLGTAMLGAIWPMIVAFFIAVGIFLTKYFWKPIKNSVSKVLNRKIR